MSTSSGDELSLGHFIDHENVRVAVLPAKELGHGRSKVIKFYLSLHNAKDQASHNMPDVILMPGESIVRLLSPPPDYPGILKSHNHRGA